MSRPRSRKLRQQHRARTAVNSLQRVVAKPQRPAPLTHLQVHAQAVHRSLSRRSSPPASLGPFSAVEWARPGCSQMPRSPPELSRPHRSRSDTRLWLFGYFPRRLFIANPLSRKIAAASSPPNPRNRPSSSILELYCRSQSCSEFQSGKCQGYSFRQNSCQGISCILQSFAVYHL